MGEIADMMLEGILDEWTGEYLGDACGYPRSLDPDHPCNRPMQEKRELTDAQRARRRRKRQRRTAKKKAATAAKGAV